MNERLSLASPSIVHIQEKPVLQETEAWYLRVNEETMSSILEELEIKGEVIHIDTWENKVAC